MILLLAMTALAAPDAASHVDQARFFLRKGWTRDAERELTQAVATPDGAQNVEAWTLLAQVRYELLDIPGATWAAQRGAALNSDAGYQVGELATFLSQSFAPLTVDGPRSGLRARVAIERSSLLLDADLSTYLATVQEQLTEPVVLPHTVWLPIGDYVVAGEPVSLPSCETPTTCVELRAALPTAQVVGGAAAVALHGTRAELQLGALMWGGAELAHLKPGAYEELSVDRALGPVWVGLSAAMVTTAYQTEGGKAHVRDIDAVGLRVAATVYRHDTLQLDILGGYRRRDTAGHRLSCATTPRLVCDDNLPDGQARYTRARAHAPWLGLRVDAGTPAPPLRVGGGVALEHAWGDLPEALVSGSGASFSYAPIVDPRAWSATGASFSIHLTAAL